MSKSRNSESADNGNPHQAPPDSDLWLDSLHWCVMRLGAHHPDSALMAGLLSYCHEFGGLTERQAKTAERIFDRLMLEYREQADG